MYALYGLPQLICPLLYVHTNTKQNSLYGQVNSDGAYILLIKTYTIFLWYAYSIFHHFIAKGFVKITGFSHSSYTLKVVFDENK